MQVVDAQGARLDAKLFIASYLAIIKLAPARFLTLRLHPDVYKAIFALADIPMSIQVGNVPGPIGRQVLKVACIKPPMGVNDGITIVQDPKADPTKLEFLLHGVLAAVVENIAYVPTAPQSSQRVN
jgi:hypothetical protein